MIQNKKLMKKLFFCFNNLDRILGVPKNVPVTHKMFHLLKKGPLIWIQNNKTFKELFMG